MNSRFAALIVCGLAVGLAVPRTAQAKIMILLSDTARDPRTGVAYMNSAIIATMAGADTAWDNKAKAVRMARGERSVILRAGNATALVNGKRVTLPAAPYLNGDMLMVPAKFTAAVFSAPLRLEEKTDSIVVGPTEGTRNPDTVFIVPMETDRTGFLIHTHKPGSMVSTNNWIQLQANVPIGQELVLQLCEADDSVLIENVLSARQRMPGQSKTRGMFSQHYMALTRATSEDNGRKVRFVAFMRKATRPPLPLPKLPKMPALPILPIDAPVVPAPPQPGAGAAAVTPK